MQLPTVQEALVQSNSFDTVIVGAGPAGLFAAHALLRAAPSAHLLIVDAGRSLPGRQQLPPTDLGGAGGAGLYLGGRLYLGPATIPVLPPVTVPAALRPILQGDAYLARAQEVDTILRSYGVVADLRQEPSAQLAAAVAAAQRLGLEYTISYPQRVAPADDRRRALSKLLDDLARRGAAQLFRTSVTSARRDGAAFALTLQDLDDPRATRLITAHTLLLASGRYGADWLVASARHLGANVVSLPTTFGVRLEMPLGAYAPLTDVNPDPRLQLALPSDAVIKTYATCPGGLVTALTRYGRLVASGVPLPLGERGPNTTVAILLQPGAEGSATSWPSGEDYARRLNDAHPGALVVQRLADLRRRIPTSAAALAANSVLPTCETATPGALHDTYPPPFWRAMDDLLSRIATLAPALPSDDLLVYGPAEERFWHVPTDDQMQSTLPGLFVAGDGPGQSQGAVQAAVAGLLAGAGLARYLS
jgi:uncharacterized FAD-dependent dehydrogenase